MPPHAHGVTAPGEDDNTRRSLSSKRYGGKAGWVGPTRARGEEDQALG
jgi:hypothetical protein